MANIPALLSVELLDALGVTVSMDTFYEVPDTTTLADLNTYLAAYLPKLDAITDSKIVGATFKPRGTLPGGLKASPDEDAENERTGLFNFSQANVPYKNGIDIPAISDAVITNGKIDLTATAVTDWVSIITTTTQGLINVSKFLNALNALLDALISFRKHRKAESRRSFEVS
jgi:hypothetical protein